MSTLLFSKNSVLRASLELPPMALQAHRRLHPPSGNCRVYSTPPLKRQRFPGFAATLEALQPEITTSDTLAAARCSILSVGVQLPKTSPHVSILHTQNVGCRGKG